MNDKSVTPGQQAPDKPTGAELVHRLAQDVPGFRVAASAEDWDHAVAGSLAARGEDCGATYTTGGADPYGTTCDQAPGHYPATPHQGDDPMGDAGRVEWRGGGSAAGDPLPYRDVRWHR